MFGFASCCGQLPLGETRSTSHVGLCIFFTLPVKPLGDVSLSCLITYLITMAFSRRFYTYWSTGNKYICQKMEKQQYIAVGPVRIAKHLQLLCLPR